MPPLIKVGDQPTLVPTNKYPYATFPFANFNPVQSAVFEFYDKDCNAVIAAATSAGKAQPDDTPVLTPHGYRRLDLIEVGDEVIGGDGKPVKVVGVYPQGKKSVYQVGFSDGSKTRCCEDHLWAVRTRTHKLRNKDFDVRSLKEIMSEESGKYHIPDSPVIEFSEKRLGLHPYVLGLLIGDGGVVYASKLTVCDEQTKAKFESHLPPGVRLVKDIGSKTCDYRIKGDGLIEPVHYELSQLGLFGLKSYQKFIPWVYLHGSVEQRQQLLAGLMDSDGGCSAARSAEFNTSSPELAKNVEFLVRSLGGWTRIREKTRVTYKYKGELREGRPCYRLTIGLGRTNPFGAGKRHVLFDEKCRIDRHKLRTMDFFKYVGEASCRCIKVANDDGLYITEDLIVTHNTVVGEMFANHEIQVRKGTFMYLCPLRALAQEKIDDWTDPSHPFSKLKVSICTGDYRLTPERKKELAEADVIIMTSEMLNHRCRNFNSEGNAFLKNIGTIVIDESHLLTVPGRGDHLEVGLMKLTKMNPNCRVVMLSATMPNVDEIAEWVSYSLTGRETYVLVSKYRPCPLTTHFENYDDSGDYYEQKEESKIARAMEIVKYYPNDKFLIFTHTKRTGENMSEELKNAGIKNEFHNADLDKEKRISLEKRFKTDPDLKVVVATSTLAWGVNLPSRRVIVLGVHRGIQEVPTYDIFQMIGRAGRPAYDPAGDAYILVPLSQGAAWRAKLKAQQRIDSQLLENVGGIHKTMAFHVVSEIFHGGITNMDEMRKWYERTLAHFQSNELDDVVADGVIKSLKDCYAINVEDDEFTVSTIGKISSLFYFSPFDVSHLNKNFGKMFKAGHETDDLRVALALGDIDSNRLGFISRAEREEISAFERRLSALPDLFKEVKSKDGEEGNKEKQRTLKDGCVKAAYLYYSLLTGSPTKMLAGALRGLKFDAPRVLQVVQALDSLGGKKWGKGDFLSGLEKRITYGVPSHLVGLVGLPNLGAVRANNLYKAGIKTMQDLAAAKPEDVVKITKMSRKMVDELIEGASIKSMME